MGLLFRQLFEKKSYTYTYIVADAETRDAFILDPVKETFDRDMQLLSELGVNLKYILETHIHADHITSSGKIREKTGAKICVGEATGLETADKLLQDGETLPLGNHSVKALSTPGHTDGCTSYHIGNYLFTGDTLLIRGCGRTDFQQGSSESLFRSVREKLFLSDDGTLVYPGHDYKGRTCSTVKEEKDFNPRLKLENKLEDFVRIMDELKLDPPAQIDVAVPANMKSGL